MTNEKEKENERKRIELIEALNKEADKPVDEMDIDEIDRLVKELDAYEEAIPDVSDYDEFLVRFNSNNNTNLNNITKENKSKTKKVGTSANSTVSKSYRFATVAAVFAIVLIYSEVIVSTATNQSIVSWVTRGYNEIVFHLDNEAYQSNIETEKENEFTDAKNFFAEMERETYVVYDLEKLKSFYIALPDYIPEGFTFEKAIISNINLSAQYITVVYRSAGDNSMSYSAAFWNSTDERTISRNVKLPYLKTVKLDDFSAYIYKDNELVAYFSINGIVYSIRSDLEETELYKVLDSINYPD